MPSKIIGLSDGPRFAIMDPRMPRVVFERPVLRAPAGAPSAAPQPGRSVFARPRPVRGRLVQLSEIGDSYERLASMVLARKMISDEPISGIERMMLARQSGLPTELAGHDLTELVFTSSADELGKGGIIGSISGAVNSAVGAVSSVVKPIATTTGNIFKAAAPALSVIPVVGPAISAGASIAGNSLNAAAGASIKSIVQNPAGYVGRIIGNVAGGAGSLVQGGAQGVGQFGEYAGSGAEYLYNGAQSFIQGGEKIFGNLTDGVMKGIEAQNPALSGQLTGLFKSIPAQYNNFSGVFDGWSSALKTQGSGSWLGKVGGEFYKIAKDASGNFSLTKHLASEVPTSIGTQIGEGTLSPAPESLFTAPSVAGAGYAPMMAGNGFPMNAAGASLPGGPYAASAAFDPSTAGLLVQAVKDSLAKSVDREATPMPAWLLPAGFGLVALMVLPRLLPAIMPAPQPQRRYAR